MPPEANEQRGKGQDAAQSALEAVDEDRLLHGEDPDSEFLEDAAHWVAVYSELLIFKERLLEVAQQGLAQLTEDVARVEVGSTDLMVLSAERSRLRRRLDFWKERQRELNPRG
jgi:hypothetical protein